MQSFFWLCLFVSCLFLLYGLMTLQCGSTVMLSTKKIPPAFVYNLTPSERLLFSSCVLEEFDKSGWTKEVIEKAEVDWNPIEDCDKDFKPYTVLGKNGTMWIDEEHKDAENVKCWSRGIYHYSEEENDYDSWTELGFEASSVAYETDFVHANCELKSTRETVQDYVHITIRTGKNQTSDGHGGVLDEEKLIETTDTRPSVYIFVLDSVANSQAWRSLPKTISLLEKEFDAVNFRHVNKVGENSFPNGMALFMGKLVTALDRRLFGAKSIEPDWNKTRACKSYHDNDGFILKSFTQKGYVSMMAEDWAYGVYNWPDCWGFEEKPVTHYMRPFQVYYETDLERSKKFMGEQQCLEYHTFLFDYQQKFIEAYPNNPKISLLWASEIAHNYNDGLFHVDDQLFNFFRQNRKEFDNSYVFFMGDHGIRWGPNWREARTSQVRKSWIGQREINNPMLYVSIPRMIRDVYTSPMRVNAGKLLTSFDIHATFVDILNDPYLGPSGPTKLRGNSILRKLPDGERSCRTLPVPLQYCLCEWKRTKINDTEIGADIGKKTTELLNQMVEEEGIDEKCEKFYYRKVNELSYVNSTLGVHEVNFVVDPCKAEFKVLVRYIKGRVQLAENQFTRMNSYGRTADCLRGEGQGDLRPICCCKDRDKEAEATTIAEPPSTSTQSVV